MNNRLTGALLALLFGSANLAAQTDVTYKIKNPSFEDSDLSAWTVSNMTAQTNNAFSLTDGITYMEAWTSKGSAVGSASLKQSVKNLVKGKYRLTVAAQNIQEDDATAEQTGTHIYGRVSTVRTVVTTPAD